MSSSSLLSSALLDIFPIILQRNPVIYYPLRSACRSVDRSIVKNEIKVPEPKGRTLTVCPVYTIAILFVCEMWAVVVVIIFVFVKCPLFLEILVKISEKSSYFSKEFFNEIFSGLFSPLEDCLSTNPLSFVFPSLYA